MNTNVLILIAAVLVSTLVYIVAISELESEDITRTTLAITKGRVAYNCMTDSDCGKSGFTGEYYCVNESIFGEHEAYMCIQNGDAGSDCVRMKSKEFVKKCADFEECKNGLDECMLKPTTIVTTLPIVVTYATLAPRTTTTTTLTNVTCYMDSQCGKDYYSGMYCSGGNGTRDHYHYQCINPGTYSSKCVKQRTTYLMEYCGYGEYCENGECIINYSVHFTPWKYPPRYNNTRFS